MRIERNMALKSDSKTNSSVISMQDAQRKLMSEMEDMVLDTFNRMKRTCTEKCVTQNYESTKLMKNEAVCMDRCVAKYMELHDIIGRNVSKDKDTYDLLAEPPYSKKKEN